MANAGIAQTEFTYHPTPAVEPCFGSLSQSRRPFLHHQERTLAKTEIIPCMVMLNHQHYTKAVLPVD
jgi:hypothetical protein